MDEGDDSETLNIIGSMTVTLHMLQTSNKKKTSENETLVCGRQTCAFSQKQLCRFGRKKQSSQNIWALELLAHSDLFFSWSRLNW